jgi:hypothetical protein
MRNLSTLLACVALLAMGAFPARACTTDAECDDGNICDGAEYCQAGICYNRTPLVCDDGDPCTVNTCDPMLGCQFAPAGGCMIGGHKLKLGSHTDLRMSLQTAGGYGGGAFPQASGPHDPVLHGASVRIYTTSGDMFDSTYGLPSSNWAYVGAADANYGYIYKDLKGALGPIRLAVIRNGKPSKVLGSGPALKFSLRADPQPLNVVLRFGDLVDCLSFGGTKFKFVPDAEFRALQAPPPQTCP